MDLFVVQQEIDELRDLNVVNCDLWPVLGVMIRFSCLAPLYTFTPHADSGVSGGSDAPSTQTQSRNAHGVDAHCVCPVLAGPPGA